MGSLRKNNFFSKVSLIITLLMIAVMYYGILPVIAEEVTLAPLNPAFFDYFQERQVIQERQVLGVQRLTLDGKALGYIPSPLELSHLKGSFLGQVHRLVGAPTSYDLRSLGKLTPVKDQGDCGSCWSFATYGSLESNLLPSETRDFSENNLKNTHGFDWGYCGGGNAFISSAYLARWSGPITESDDPYTPHSGSSPSGLTPQKHQQEILIIPDRAGSLDNENIKQMVMTYGAVYTTMFYDSSFYNSDYKTYYYNGSSYSNHAVAIVGWNDSFDGSKFVNTPPGDGAFIIRNSWGESWGENGYFYISYYDSNIGAENFVFNDAESTTNYSNIYQYDPLGWVSSVGYGSNTAWFANIFTATASEQLTAVSFYTASLNSLYEIYIYTNVTSGPISGTPAVSKTGSLSIPGYHTISLDSPVSIASGQKFSVVVKLATPGYNFPVPIESQEAGYSSNASASAGQSYISSNGSSWSDITSLSWCTECNVCLKAFTSGSTTGFSASGQVTTNGLAGISGVLMTFNRVPGTGTVPASVQSDVDGKWIQSGFKAGTTYRVTPSKSGYIFTPYYLDFNDEITELNFTGSGPGITVITPNNNETWTAGSARIITWTYTGTPGSYVKIELLKSGVLNRTITSSTSIVSGSYNWNIPSTQVQGSDYTIKITSTSNSSCSDTSDVFTINGPTITVTSPSIADTWDAGTLHLITWSYTGNPGTYVKIELLKGGVLNRTIKSSVSKGTSGSGSYNWTIPSTQTGGTDYRIRVKSTSNTAITDTSDADFTILGPTITVTSPNGGESWTAGSTQTISWSYTDNPGTYVKIELLKGGVLNRTIISSVSKGTSGSGSYNWTIPSTQTGGTDYRIRVKSTSNTAITDTSDADFTI